MCHGQVACYTLDTYGPNIPWIPWQQQTDHKKNCWSPPTTSSMKYQSHHFDFTIWPLPNNVKLLNHSSQTAEPTPPSRAKKQKNTTKCDSKTSRNRPHAFCAITKYFEERRRTDGVHCLSSCYHSWKFLVVDGTWISDHLHGLIQSNVSSWSSFIKFISLPEYSIKSPMFNG